jgi:cation transport regulator ChaB
LWLASLLSTVKFMPAAEEIPSTIARSPQHARAIWSAAHDAAVESYGEGERAHRTAFAALKHSYEKVGDHWEKKAEPGPSDAKAAGGADSPEPTEEGVNATAPKAHLYEVATGLKITGRSTMTKAELVEAIKKENARRTRVATR